jgi:hypothetical protein
MILEWLLFSYGKSKLYIVGMTAADFRRLALAFPEATEAAHMGHPDFRVRDKIFATLWPEEGRGVVLLTPEQQKVLAELKPTVFTSVPGGWGRRGSTNVNLQTADELSLTSALLMAWRNKAPASSKK